MEIINPNNKNKITNLTISINLIFINTDKGDAKNKIFTSKKFIQYLNLRLDMKLKPMVYVFLKEIFLLEGLFGLTKSIFERIAIEVFT